MTPEEQERAFNRQLDELFNDHDAPGLILNFSVTRLDPLLREEWEELRQMRNACAAFMTGFTGQIIPLRLLADSC